MSDKNWIKKRLMMSSTLPAGAANEGTAPTWMMGSAAHDHVHSADGSCCDHDHMHEHKHAEDCDGDHTSPKGDCC